MARLREKLSPRGERREPVRAGSGRSRCLASAFARGRCVERICSDVGRKGLAAALDYTARIDKAQLRLDGSKCRGLNWTGRMPGPTPEFLQAVGGCREKHRVFQEGHPASRRAPRAAGRISSGADTGRWDRVGICVPGGAAAYPSSVLMTAVPAQVAGVKELAVVAPPTKFGAYNADMLPRVMNWGSMKCTGWAGAGVAALAYGVEGIPRVDQDRRAGPICSWRWRKKFVFGEVDIDSISRAERSVVIVDESTKAGVYRF